MTLDDFDFDLPQAQIAQHPLSARDASRLLVLHRRTGAFAHRAFTDLPSLLRAGDLVVLNDTRVIPARLVGQKVGTGGRAELLLVRPAAAIDAASALQRAAGDTEWICLGQASKGLKPGTRIAFAGGLFAEITEAPGGGEVRVRLEAQATTGGDPAPALSAHLKEAGQLPLPPYIERLPEGEDEERYQTIFARTPGSVAAPTAALHFTEAVMAGLVERGVHTAHVTLDVGPGTFLPVRDDLDAHRMHEERFTVPEATAEAIARTKAGGGRIVAVGTTVVRTLESATDPQTGGVRPGEGETRLFIRPGFAFRQVDALLTNFHLPRSTLLMLVSAFAGHAETLSAYRAAVEANYRFFSYGDAMFISDGAP